MVVVVVGNQSYDCIWCECCIHECSCGGHGRNGGFVVGGDGAEEDGHMLVIGNGLAHCGQLLMKVSDVVEMGTYIVVLPAFHRLNLPV